MSRILVVDDDAAVCRGLGDILRHLGHRVEVAASAAVGRALLQQRRVDLVLADWRMPGEDGLSFTRSLRTSHPHLPVVLLSAYLSAERVDHAIAAGCSAALAKPIDLDQLEAVLERVATDSATRTDLLPPTPELHEGLRRERTVDPKAETAAIAAEPTPLPVDVGPRPTSRRCRRRRRRRRVDLSFATLSFALALCAVITAIALLTG